MQTVELNESYIKMAEDAIMANNFSDINAISISYQYYYDAKLGYDTILNSPPTSYVRFAENAMGMQVYGYYKARNNQVYIINSFMNEIQTIYIPSDEYLLRVASA